MINTYCMETRVRNNEVQNLPSYNYILNQRNLTHWYSWLHRIHMIPPMSALDNKYHSFSETPSWPIAMMTFRRAPHRKATWLPDLFTFPVTVFMKPIWGHRQQQVNESEWSCLILFDYEWSWMILNDPGKTIQFFPNPGGASQGQPEGPMVRGGLFIYPWQVLTKIYLCVCEGKVCLMVSESFILSRCVAELCSLINSLLILNSGLALPCTL